MYTHVYLNQGQTYVFEMTSPAETTTVPQRVFLFPSDSTTNAYCFVCSVKCVGKGGGGINNVAAN